MGGVAAHEPDDDALPPCVFRGDPDGGPAEIDAGTVEPEVGRLGSVVARTGCDLQHPGVRRQVAGEPGRRLAGRREPGFRAALSETTGAPAHLGERGLR